MKTKHYIILLLFSFAGMKAAAQKTANNWLFGNRVGISFNESPPAPIVNGQLSSFEGCSSASDGNGKLLFYSNGVKVYNKNNQVMENGEGLLGDLSSTSNSIAVLEPGSSDKYYLFVVSASGIDPQPFSYSVIDMAAANNPGAVSATEKNIIVRQPAFEKIAAVRHCNKKDVWIVVKGWNNDEYYSYLLTSAGLSTTPVISITGFDPGNPQNNYIGAIKFSADGKMLAAAYAGDINRVQLLRFNSTTGTLSNSIVFDPNITAPDIGFRGVYGVEFSPDGKLLYVSSNNNFSQTLMLYQFDPLLNSAGEVVTSRQLIAERGDWFAGGLQLGPDQKIYLALWKDSALSVIENPDIPGTGCNFNYNAVRLKRNGSTGYLSESGLPGFIASDLVPQYADYKFSVIRNGCTSKEIECRISYTGDVDSVRWDFGDGQQSTQPAPIHDYTAFGTYTIVLKIYRKGCTINELQTLTYTQVLELENAVTRLPADMSFCGTENITLKPSGEAESYLWSTGQTTDSIMVTQSGLYWLEMKSNGCVSRDTIILSEKPALRIELGNDTTVCVEKAVLLRTTEPGTNYVWNDGTTGPAITVTKPGSYWIKFESAVNCIISDTVNVSTGNCEIYFPTAFTPNNDGRNDQFGLVQNTAAKTFELTICNRSGQIVFQSNDQYKKWDGTMKAKKQPMGTYVWIMKFRPANGLEQVVKGTVLLIR